MAEGTTLMIRELPETERPLEKLSLLGAAHLTDRELIAIVLGSGTRSLSALGLADSLLSKFGSLANVADASIEELQELSGIGTVKAARVSAACELGRRLVYRTPARPVIHTVHDVVDLVQPLMRHLDREEFRAVLLDTKHRLVELYKVSLGHLTGTLVHPREVFKQAIRRSCDAIVVVHNHPSGDPTPSPEDLAVTRRLVAASRIIGIELLDHVIVGYDDFVSLRQEGYLNLDMPEADSSKL